MNLVKVINFTLLILSLSIASPMLWNKWLYDEDDEIIVIEEDIEFIYPVSFGNIELKHNLAGYFIVKKNLPYITIHPLNIDPLIRFLSNEELISFFDAGNCIEITQDSIGLYGLQPTKRSYEIEEGNK